MRGIRGRAGDRQSDLSPLTPVISTPERPGQHAERMPALHPAERVSPGRDQRSEPGTVWPATEPAPRPVWPLVRNALTKHFLPPLLSLYGFSVGFPARHSQDLTVRHGTNYRLDFGCYCTFPFALNSS
jgi:hypothetical protein